MIKKIPKAISVNYLDQLYKELETWGEPVDLLLPNEIKSWDFGITSLIIQFVNTWVRSEAAGKLILDVNHEDIELERIARLDVIFPGIIMSWDRGVVDLQNISLKPAIRPINEAVIHSMQSLENLPLFDKTFIPQKGYKSLLTCFDHLPSNKGLLGCFYSHNDFILSENTLSDSLEETLNYILSFNSKSRGIIKPVKRELVAIIYELMKNTHDWGRTDANSRALIPNVRGTYIKFIKKSKDHFLDNYGDHIGFQNYFNGLKPTRNNELYFIEISVFDSGVGFIEKYSKTPSNMHSVRQQVDILKECLIKNNTSDKTLAREGKGLGLDKIMQILDKKGLFFIRTGNVFVVRNMKDNHYVATKNKDEMELFDFKTYSSSQFSRYTNCSGSSISIVYPLAMPNE